MIRILKEKLFNPILQLLKQGITPEKISLSIAIGGSVGIFPVIGLTSILCSIFGVSLRLNMIAIQIVNYAVYPIQIILLIPFVRLGENILGVNPFPISPTAIINMLNQGLFNTILYFWDATMHGILGWAICSIPLSILTYFVFLHFLKIAEKKIKKLKKAEVV